MPSHNFKLQIGFGKINKFLLSMHGFRCMISMHGFRDVSDQLMARKIHNEDEDEDEDGSSSS